MEYYSVIGRKHLLDSAKELYYMKAVNPKRLYTVVSLVKHSGNGKRSVIGRVKKG